MLIGFTSGSSGSDSDLSDSTKTERRSPHGITVTQTLTSTPTSLPHPHLAVGESARVHPVSSGMTNHSLEQAKSLHPPKLLPGVIFSRWLVTKNAMKKKWVSFRLGLKSSGSRKPTTDCRCVYKQRECQWMSVTSICVLVKNTDQT